MINPLVEYYRCEERIADFYQTATLSNNPGFFRLGDSVCYGQCNGGTPSFSAQDPLYNCADDLPVPSHGEPMLLPFDPAQIISNLLMESYTARSLQSRFKQVYEDFLHRSYYAVRPLLPVKVRRHFQKLHLRSKRQAAFPSWPVDCTVEKLMERFLQMAILASGESRVPFIWFWPEGMDSAVIMTHDVETQTGLDFCHALMDVDESYGIKSSFQIVPEERYTAPKALLDAIRARGFEVNVHDLNHDGHLFRKRDKFLFRAARINRYLNEFDALGFRAGVMYRNQEWFDALDASYDMSVPNAAHLDPQSGGCCTVMPYFIGNVLEIPVTTTQDYPLFNILKDYSIELWRREIEMVQERHGLVSFVVHPDYVRQQREQDIYRELLDHLRQIRNDQAVWFALPREINEWWRQRSAMRLLRNGSSWIVEGPGKERARIAYASLQDSKIVYSVESSARMCTSIG